MVWLGRNDKVLSGTLSPSFIQCLGEVVGKDKRLQSQADLASSYPQNNDSMTLGK